MKPLSETRALEKLHTVKTDFAKRLRAGYEHRAKDCLVCDTPGACCLDAHFVNVHITRLEAVAIADVIGKLPKEKQSEIAERVERTIVDYDLDAHEDSFSKTYACPLFENGIGCLVHQRGKPLPCIAHACYENKEDLPPDELLAEQQGLVENLNELTYRTPQAALPLPIAIKRYARRVP